MAVKKYLVFLKCLFIELRAEINEALAARAQFKAIEKITANAKVNGARNVRPVERSGTMFDRLVRF